MTLRGLAFILRVWLRTLRDWVFGIECSYCGDRARLPVPPGWRWTTSWDGEARWICGDCRAGDDDRNWIH